MEQSPPWTIMYIKYTPCSLSHTIVGTLLISACFFFFILINTGIDNKPIKQNREPRNIFISIYRKMAVLEISPLITREKKDYVIIEL